ncbi:MAG: flagellar biosynthesis anti-sigma factor FlgM [Epulopiscium sp.]|mgnify:CR=1 FL=1|nr:flagellar biosynthesis anti-sigma factor FlgM [Candidatus Epulonipiscium sp.]
MKINNIHQISKIYEATSTRKISSKTNKNGEKDKLEISTTARHYQTGINAVKNSPDIRQDKVDKIKRQMESGTYNVSAEEVAKKMMAEFFDHSI